MARRRPRRLSASFSVTDVPEILAQIRNELAAVLREVAADEDPRTAKRLREIADAFEAGQQP